MIAPASSDPMAACHSLLWQAATACCGKPPLPAVASRHCLLWQAATACCGTPPLTAVASRHSGLWQAATQGCGKPPPPAREVIPELTQHGQQRYGIVALDFHNNHGSDLELVKRIIAANFR